MCRMTVRTFLVWKFPEIRHMESLLTYQLWFWWKLFVKNVLFIENTKLKNDLLWDLRPNRQRQNDRTLILLLWGFYTSCKLTNWLFLKRHRLSHEECYKTYFFIWSHLRCVSKGFCSQARPCVLAQALCPSPAGYEQGFILYIPPAGYDQKAFLKTRVP